MSQLWRLVKDSISNLFCRLFKLIFQSISNLFCQLFKLFCQSISNLFCQLLILSRNVFMSWKVLLTKLLRTMVTRTLHTLPYLNTYFVPNPEDPTYDHQENVLFSPNYLLLIVTNVSQTPLDSRYHNLIHSSIGSDDFAQDILDHIIPCCASCSRFKLRMFISDEPP